MTPLAAIWLPVRPFLTHFCCFSVNLVIFGHVLIKFSYRDYAQTIGRVFSYKINKFKKNCRTRFLEAQLCPLFLSKNAIFVLLGANILQNRWWIFFIFQSNKRQMDPFLPPKNWHPQVPSILNNEKIRNYHYFGYCQGKKVDLHLLRAKPFTFLSFFFVFRTPFDWKVPNGSFFK